VLYHEVLALNARWRPRVVADGALPVATLPPGSPNGTMPPRSRCPAIGRGPGSALALSALPYGSCAAAKQIGRRKPYGRRLRLIAVCGLIATMPSGRLGQGLFEWPPVGRHCRELPLLSAAT
jgi:hypothetical protein